jgi:hypothetical protein
MDHLEQSVSTKVTQKNVLAAARFEHKTTVSDLLYPVRVYDGYSEIIRILVLSGILVSQTYFFR